MEYFKLNTAWNSDQNSPWDALWYDGDYNDLDSLDGSLPLAPIWKSPSVSLQARDKSPDIYSFQSHYAVTASVKQCMYEIVQDEVEFLPLEMNDHDTLFVIHPLWPLDFDSKADYSCNATSGNITVVKKYSFTIDPREFPEAPHMFRLRQAVDSHARSDGLAVSTVLLSKTMKNAVEKHGADGVTFEHVHST